MEVNFTPEQESRLHEVAARTGKDPRQVVEESINRMLDYDERFLAGGWPIRYEKGCPIPSFFDGWAAALPASGDRAANAKLRFSRARTKN